MKFEEKYAHLIEIVENWDDRAEEHFDLSNTWKKPTRKTPDLYTVGSLNNPKWFRLRPETKMVHFWSQDIKPGMVFKHQSWKSGWMSPVVVTNGMVHWATISRMPSITFKDLRESYLWSTDGVTWHKCEKEATNV